MAVNLIWKQLSSITPSGFRGRSIFLSVIIPVVYYTIEHFFFFKFESGNGSKWV